MKAQLRVCKHSQVSVAQLTGEDLLTPDQGGASGSLPQVAAVCSGRCPGAKHQRAQCWHKAAPLQHVTPLRGFTVINEMSTTPLYSLNSLCCLGTTLWLNAHQTIVWMLYWPSSSHPPQSKQLLAWRIGGPDQEAGERGSDGSEERCVALCLVSF